MGFTWAKWVVKGLAGLSLAAALVSCVYAPGYYTVGQMLSLSGLVWLAVLATVMALRHPWRVAALMFALAAPWALIEGYLALHYGAQINSHTLTLMLGSDSGEAWNYLRSLWLWISLALLAPVFGFWAAARLWRVQGLASGERRTLALGGVGAALATMAIATLALPPERADRHGDVTTLTGRFLERVHPWGIPSRLWSFAAERQRAQQLEQMKADFRFGAQSTVDARTVVVVFGESSAASHWQLGDYGRPTNPRLAQRQDVIWLSDFAVNAVVTAESIPLMLTRKPVAQAGSAMWPEKSWISAFNEAGYETHWISNQATAGLHDLLIASYAREAQHQTFLNVATHEQAGAHDSDLLPLVNAAMARPARKKLIVLHLMGSHFAYRDRYPAIDALFHDGRDERARWRDDYDNSIRHTDRVLATLIEALEARQEASALLYLSDHGQLLPEADCDKRWHGHGAVDDVFAAALVWLSAHADDWHEARARLGTHARRKTQGKEVFQTVLDAGGIELRGQGRLSSWLKGDYQDEPRIVSVLGRFVDADSEPIGGCLLLQATDKALSLSGDVGSQMIVSSRDDRHR